MTKLKAALLHLTLSITIVGTALILMLTLWYPNVYFKLMNGKELIFLIGGVDIFLGPMLTFVVFQKNKKSLKFDLAVISFLQVAALCYGLKVMYDARPVFTVFNKNSFQVLSALDIVPSELTLAKKKEWRSYSVTGPTLVAISKVDKSNKKEWFFAAAAGDGVVRYPRLYDDYNKHQPEVIAAGLPLSELIQLSDPNKVAIEKFMSKRNSALTDFLYLPTWSMTNEMAAIINAKTGEFVQIIDAKQANNK